ncbi:MAG: hypothetical protein Q9183_007855, partial [Haloplaca sp. 2 TL-2023]
MSGAPVGSSLVGQTAASLDDLEIAEVQPQSTIASLGSGRPPLDDEPITPGDLVNENGQVSFASLVMMGFGSATGSAALTSASPEAGTQLSPTGELFS